MFFKSKKQAKDETDKNLQVNVDLEIVTKMNQEFAVSLDLNDTLKTALQVIIARINAEAANIYAKAYNKDPDFYKFMKTMDIFKDALGKETILVLSTDGEFLRYLNEAK